MTNQTPNSGDFDPNDPIAAAWGGQKQTGGDASLPTDLGPFADSVATAHRKEQRRLLWLNFREVVPSFALAAVFLVLTSEAGRPRALQAAALIYALIGCFILLSSIRHHRADGRWGASIRDQIDRRLAQLNHRAWMYRNLAWWYFLPLTIGFGLVLFGFGIEESGVSGAIVLAVHLVAVAGLYLA